MPLIRRVPKRGFTNIFRTEYSVVNVQDLRGISRARSRRRLWPPKGLVRAGMPVKILGDGEIASAITVAAHKFSKSARAKIEAAGGSCQEYGK